MAEKKRSFEAEVRSNRPLTLQPEPQKEEDQDLLHPTRLSRGEFPFTRELILRLIERIQRA